MSRDGDDVPKLVPKFYIYTPLLNILLNRSEVITKVHIVS